MRRVLFREALPGVLGGMILVSSVSFAQTAGPPQVVARWLFDEGKGETASDGADGRTNGKVVRAAWSEGRSGGALAFEDYSTRDYLKPDVREATKVIVPHDPRLNPSGPFSLKAVIYPVKDPLYYGGIIEKGRGLGASYRLLLLRGLRLRAALGGGQVAVTSAGPISLNAWHDVEMIFDGSTLVLRVDGKEQARAPAATISLTSKEEVLIGDRFSGRIDEVALTLP